MNLLFVILLSLSGVAQVLGVGVVQQSGKYEAAGISDDAAAEKFFHELQKAVADDDRAKVATMIAVPIVAYTGRRKVRFRSKLEVLKKYDLVFNQKVKQALARQNVSDLFVNSQGIMVGDGEIWFNQISGSDEFKVIAINNN